MGLLDFKLNGATVEFNYLFDPMPAEWLDQDLMFIRLADGTFVDVGWYEHEGEPGYYRVTHLSADWSQKLIRFQVRTPSEVRSVLERLTRETSAPQIPPMASAPGAGTGRA